MTQEIEVISAALAGRYRIERELGAGGMATVYLAEDLKHARPVAIKVLRSAVAQSVGAARFLAEIRLTANFQHPHILPLFDSGDIGGIPYYVMPYVDGETLRARLDRAAPLPLAEALEIAEDIASALTFAHGRGVVHRDVKPENVLLKDGEALVADFGIALAVARLGSDRLTLTGTSIGTPAYMSPEQIGGEEVDGRTDQYALGVILYEMLAGRPPFDGPTAQAVFARVLTEPVPPLAAFGVHVPAVTEAAVVRGLAKSPEERFATVREFIAACAPPLAAPTRSRWPGVAAAGALLIAAAAAAALWSTRAEAGAAALLPRIEALAAGGDYFAAFQLAEDARPLLEQDSTFQTLYARISNEITIRTEPAGARAFLAGFGDTTVPDSARGAPIGTTPISRYVVPRGDYRLLLEAPGRLPVRRIVSRSLTPSEGRNPAHRHIELDVTLPEEGSVPDGMEPVPGGPYEIVGHDVARGEKRELAPFAIDRYEVSNERFADFVRAGGYDRPALRDGLNDSTRASLVDRTGLPGPRAWINGDPPDGLHKHPVTGVSWHEAAAYCAWRGGRLPSLFEWEKASRDGRISRRGVLMPWGQWDPHAIGVARANFVGRGTAPVDSFAFGTSPYGVYNMAGNVKEWLANRIDDGWGTVGGSWQDPMYLFSQVGSHAPDGSPAIGFRCVRPASGSPALAGTEPLDASIPLRRYSPVSEDELPALLAHYRYDRRPANPRAPVVDQTPDWTLERLWIDGPQNDSILIYLYVPAASAPPYQLLVHIPSSFALVAASMPPVVEEIAAGQIKAGRAVLAPVLAGMAERRGAVPGWPAPGSVEFRDLMVRHATEMRLAMDYAAARPDIDSTRIGYLAVSLGAGSRLPLAAVDPRFKAVVLIGAGIDERLQPTLPEAANVNFAPYIEAPKLVVNGRQDEEHPWQTRGLALWELLREPKELLLVDGAGHLVPPEIRTPRINSFLDQVLGTPAQRR